MKLPVVIVHYGGSPSYLKFALEGAARFNKEVVLIGDESNQALWTNHWNSDEAILDNYKRFQRSYVKMSDYPDSYENAFWKRFFALEHWMKHERVDELFLLDSDVMTYADYSKKVVPLLGNACRAALVTKMDQEDLQWASSAHFSYWKRDALEDFVKFCLNAYDDNSIRKRLEKKYRQRHLEKKKPGGICDMTLLHLWQENSSGTVSNLAKVTNGVAADWCITEPGNYVNDEYEMRSGFKKFIFKNGIPYAYNKILGSEVRFLCVHCVGNSKPMMQFLRKGRCRFHFELYCADQFFSERLGRLRRSVSRVFRS
jgi:hypothetical protein